MEISSLNRSVHASEVPVEQLAGNKQLSEADKISEVSRQFEALLLRQVLAQANKTHFRSRFTDNSATSSIYQDMVSNQLADAMSKANSVGLAQTLRHQLDREIPIKAKDPA